MKEILLTDDKQFFRDNQGSAHIAFSLRVRHDIKKVQFFDTGALNIAGNGSDLFATGGGNPNGNYDSIGTTKVRSLSSPYKGTGVFPKLDVAGAQKLKDAIVQFSKARPIGLARFALLDRAKLALVQANNPQVVAASDGALIYASALLPMWGADEDQNYYISRYLWSLRNLPNSANLEAVWMLYVPQGQYAKALANGGRSAKVIDVAKGILPAKDFARELAKVVSPLQDLVVTVDGKVKTLAQGGSDVSAKHLLHKLEGRMPNGPMLLRLDMPFPTQSATFDHNLLPPYFV